MKEGNKNIVTEGLFKYVKIGKDGKSINIK